MLGAGWGWIWGSTGGWQAWMSREGLGRLGCPGVSGGPHRWQSGEKRGHDAAVTPGRCWQGRGCVEVADVEPGLWVGGFWSPAPLRPVGWCFSNLSTLTKNPNMVAQRFLVLGCTGSCWGPTAPLGGGFCLWAMAKTPRPAAFAPKGPECCGSKRASPCHCHAARRGDPGDWGAAPTTTAWAPTCAVFPHQCCCRLSSNPIPSQVSVRGAAGSACSMCGPRATSGEGQGGGDEAAAVLGCVGDFVGDRQAQKPPEDAWRCRTTEVYPTWSDDLFRVSVADELLLPSCGWEQGGLGSVAKLPWWDAPSLHPATARGRSSVLVLLGQLGLVQPEGSELAVGMPPHRSQVLTGEHLSSPYGSCCPCCGEPWHRLL